MVEVPSGLISLWPPGSGARTLRAWAGAYGTQHGFTSPRLDEPEQFHNSPEQDAFRHAFVASAIYLENYNRNRMLGVPHDEADRRATATTLGLGNINEVMGPNPLAQHLKDYWNNYEGVALAREIATEHGADISNDDLAQIVAGEINRSIRSPIGKSRFILYHQDRNENVHMTDPRLDVNRYDTKRLPNEGWGIRPYPQAEGNVPPAIIQAFPKLYQSPAPPPSSAPWHNLEPADVPDPTLTPAIPSQHGGGRTYLDFGSEPTRLGALNPSASTALSAGAQRSDPWQQAMPSADSGVPQHVIDAGNTLRTNGYEITPRTMYLAHVLGPQGAVDLMKRTGSTGSPPQVPSPDAATGDQMLAWVRALRLGPAAAGIAPMAPAASPTRAVPDQSNVGTFDPTQSPA